MKASYLICAAIGKGKFKCEPELVVELNGQKMRLSVGVSDIADIEEIRRELHSQIDGLVDCFISHEK